jgi:hypothetical protein
MGHRADIPRSTVSRYVNQAYADVVAMTEPVKLERLAVSSTTSGENRISLPADFAEPINLSFLTEIGSARTLQQVGPSIVDATGFTPIGIPSQFVLFNDWIELHPSPNSAYSLQLRYRSYNTDLVDTGDVPSVSTPWRFPIVLKAQQYLHEWLGDFDRAGAAANAFAGHVSGLDTDKARKQKDKAAMRARVIYSAPVRSRSSFERPFG